MDASSHFAAFLADNQLKMTRERRAVLEEMLAVRGHLDADQLLEMFRRKGRPVSRATLYRTLARLVEAGLVHKIEMARGQARYEPMFGRDHHDHMVCLECGRIIEFESQDIERLQEQICRDKRFTMLGHTHQIRGQCAGCSARSSRAAAPRPRRRAGRSPGRAKKRRHV
jgi:Fur family ferric uptake transcriptional regulator